MKVYLTLCYSIEYRDVGLLQNIVRGVCIIIQALESQKPKFACELLWKLNIIDTIAANPILQYVHLATALVNPPGLLQIFNEIDLFLKHQNSEFKCFWSD